MSVPSTLVSEVAQENIQRLADQFTQKYSIHPKKQRFDELLTEYQKTEIHRVPEFKTHELFDLFLTNPEIDTFVPKATNVIIKLKDFLAQLIRR